MKIFSDRNDFKFCSELVVLYGMLDKEPIESPENEGRFNGAKEACDKYITYVSSEDEADVIVLSHKFCGKFPKTSKKVWCFYNDDCDKTFDLPDNVRLFRTSFYKSTKLPNERALPTFSPDYFKGNYSSNTSVGFCGSPSGDRLKYLKEIYDSSIKTDFILRRGFWAPGMDKMVARREYFENISNNIFTFCYRGAGNFSYRFYETMMMGRIPVLVDTDCVFPIDIKPYCVYCLPGDNLEHKIKKFILKNDLIEIQKLNRKIWEKYFSPGGFIRSITI